MAVAERQGRDRPAKIEQRREGQGRSEDQSEDLRQNKQHSWLSPVYTGQAQGEEKSHEKRSRRALARSLPRAGSHLWIGTPSCLQDAFSCYFLMK